MSYDIQAHITTQAYIPSSDWPTLTEMAAGFGEHSYPRTDVLAGRTLPIRFANGWLIEHRFHDGERLTWTVREGQDAGRTGTATYHAVEARAGLLFVDFFKPDDEEVVTLIIREDTGDLFAALSSYHEVNGERRTRTQFVNGRVDGAPGGRPIEQSSSLVGKRILYRYSSDDWYEHVYFNRECMAWHCVNGAEKGIADVERCAYFDVEDDLHILFWTETVLPLESIVLIDLAKMRSTGRFFGWDPKPQTRIHLNFGSFATKLNETTYPTL